MIRSIWTAASGMEAQQMNVDVVSNNLANVNTTGFKKSRANFQDLMYQTMLIAGATTPGGGQIPTGIQVGMGTKPSSVQKLFTQGDYIQTGNDLAIQLDAIDPTADSDGDGVNDEQDNCPNTPSGTQVDENGCTVACTDSDSDGVCDDQDDCPNSPSLDVVGPDGCSVLRFTDMGDGTVKDNASGLIWLKDASCSELPGTDSNGMASWETAKDAAAALADSICGLTDGSTPIDWRLPTKAEWEAFIDTSYTEPALCNAAGNGQWTEGDAFTGVQSTTYWSSDESISGYAWDVRMGIGDVTHNPIANYYYVWPVRSDN